MQPNKWSDHWMRMARLTAEMSKDASFKAGAVLVGSNNRTLFATGYNGPPPAMRDDQIDQTDRQLVRAMTCHAESNCLWFAVAAQYDSLMGSILYVNAKPCHRCVVEMVRADVYACVYDDTNPNQPKMVDDAEWQLSQLAAYKGDLQLIPYSTLKGQ